MQSRLNKNKSNEFVICDFPLSTNIDESMEIQKIKLKNFKNTKIIVNDIEGPYPHCHIIEQLSNQKPKTICCIRLDANAYFQHTEEQKLNSKPLKKADEELFYKIMSSPIDKSEKNVIKIVKNITTDIDKIDTYYDLAREAWNRNLDPKSDKKFLVKMDIPKYNIYMKSHDEQKKEDKMHQNEKENF